MHLRQLNSMLTAYYQASLLLHSAMLKLCSFMWKTTGMSSCFSLLNSISAKCGVVPAHIGGIHVHVVNINPEIDTKNRLMRLDINSEQGIWRYKGVPVSIFL